MLIVLILDLSIRYFLERYSLFGFTQLTIPIDKSEGYLNNIVILFFFYAIRDGFSLFLNMVIFNVLVRYEILKTYLTRILLAFSILSFYYLIYIDHFSESKISTKEAIIISLVCSLLIPYLSKVFDKEKLHK